MARRVLAALLPLLIGAAPPAPIGTAVLNADAEARWVPFTLTGAGQIRFNMTLDGQPVTAILDTGVSHTVLARGSAAFDPARARGGRPGTSNMAAAIGGAVAIGWQRTEGVALGGLHRRGGEVAVAALPAHATGGGVDLLVGRDLTAAHALDIDYPARRFRLLPSGRLPFAGGSAPLVVSGARRVYESAVTLGGRRLSPMIVDTGDGAQLTVTEAGWRASGVAAPTTSALSYGVAGPVTTGLAIAPAAALGETAPRAVEVRIEPAAGFSHAVGVAGRIGGGFLQSYRVLLDPGAGRMVLSRRAGDAPAPPRSTSGLLLAAAPDRLRVLHVMRGGPAAAAGWRAGEEICAVDGRPASGTAGWTTGVPGTAVTLSTCAGETRRLVLRAFY